MAADVFKIVGTTQGGNFHVERVVAEGGFSVVYRALHGAFRAPVALKCLKVPDDLTLDQRDGYLERFREEAELLFRLSARIPEVVRPLHVDKLTLKDGRFAPFLALEWLDGESLSDAVAGRKKAGAAPMGLVKLVKLLSPVAHAVSRAHRFPTPTGRIAIIHCDLKPENVYIAKVDGTESARVLDYGIAMAMRTAGRKSKPRVGEWAEPAYFTPGYAAPEQWSPRRFGPTGPKTDVWGLALTLVEAITAKQPLGDGSESAMKAAATDEKRRPTPRTLGATVPDDIEAAFVKALAVHPKDRTEDVAAFWSELERALSLPMTFLRRDDRSDPDHERFPSLDPKLRLDDDLEPVRAPAEEADLPVAHDMSSSKPPPEVVRLSAAPELDLGLEEPFTFDQPGVDVRAGVDGRVSFEGELPKTSQVMGPSMQRDLKELELDLPDDLGLSVLTSTSGELELAPSSRGQPVGAGKKPDRPPPPAPHPPPPRKVEAPVEEAKAAPVQAAPVAEAPAAKPKKEADVEAKPAARLPLPSDADGPIGFELSAPERAGAGAIGPIGVGGAAARRPANLYREPTPDPPSLRLPVQLMIGGGLIAVVSVVAAPMVEELKALGAAPRVGGIVLFGVGLLMLFWRIFDR